ncbi:MAG: hypothetical protein JO278_03350 [Dyella sp.]|nr:hypothetical protein [Dyella sp.]
MTVIAIHDPVGGADPPERREQMGVAGRESCGHDSPVPAQGNAIPWREILVRRAVVEPMSARVAPAPRGDADYRASCRPCGKLSTPSLLHHA